MKKTIITVAIAVIILESTLLLFYFLGSYEQVSDASKNNALKSVDIETTITLDTGVRFRFAEKRFMFIGFVNEDTIGFANGGNIVNFHLAKEGYQFKLPDLDEVKLEITAFNREEGSITLKVMETIPVEKERK